MLSPATANREFVELVASEMATCVDRAVERWMAEFDSALNHQRLTTLGRLQAVREIVARYRDLTGSRESSSAVQLRRTTRVGTTACGRPAE